MTNPLLSLAVLDTNIVFPSIIGKNKSVLRADGLQRSLRRIFIAPALERGRANHHPCPLLKGGGLRRKLSRYFMGITDFT